MKKRNMFLFIFIFCLFFAGINGVSADGGYCPVGTSVDKAYACDYSSDNMASNVKYTMLFVKNSDGGYCAEIADLDLTIKGGFFSNIANNVTMGWAFGDVANQSFTEQEKRKVASIGLGADTIKSVFDTNSCPKLKMDIYTNGFNETGAKKLNVTTEDFDDFAMCQLTAGTGSYISDFCVLSDGSNFREINKEEAGDVIEDANDDREGPSIAEILNWASNNGYNDVNSLGDDCSLISDELKKMLNTAFWLISVVAIILLVVLTALGFIKAIVASDDQKLKDAFSHLLTRIIVLIILLLLPVILSFIIEIINANSTGKVAIGEDGNIFCDVTGSGSSSSSSSSEGGTSKNNDSYNNTEVIQ